MPTALSIAVIAQPDYEYARKILRGMAEYCTYRALAPVWINPMYRPIPDPRRWQVSGVIAAMADVSMVRQATRWRLPTINVSGRLNLPGLPLVTIDNHAVGAVAARHLMARGVAHLAYLGPDGHYYAQRRRDGFVEELRRHDRGASVLMVPRGQLPMVDGVIRQWLAELPRPLGLMACNDQWAVLAAQACRRAGLTVPGDVAIVGSDNDELHCLLNQPSISSVHNNFETVGREAVRLLETWLLTGQRPPAQTLVPPGAMVVRRSSDPVATGDPLINAAVKHIGATATQGLTVEGLLDEVPVSRRKLEKRFMEILGRTPAAEIRRVQLERAKQLLVDTDLPLDDVAQASGLGYQRQLRMLFQRELGISPSVFRAGFQHADPGGRRPARPTRRARSETGAGGRS